MRTELGSPQQCPVTAQKAQSTNWNTRKHFCATWWYSTGTGCPEWLGGVSSSVFKSFWTWSWASCSGWPWLSRGGTKGLPESLQHQLECDSVKKNPIPNSQAVRRRLRAGTAMHVAPSWSCNVEETPSKVLFKQQVTELPVKMERGMKQKGLLYAIAFVGQNSYPVRSYSSARRTLADGIIRNCTGEVIKHYCFYFSHSCLRTEE